MKANSSLRPLCLLIGAILFGQAAFAQSLSIKKAGAGYAIDARAPAGTPSTLQASENLHLWIDVQENIEDLFTYTLPDNIAKRYYRLVPSTNAPDIRVVLIGDSMVADCCGWGAGLPTYFKPNSTVLNYAQPWTSSKAFLQSAEMDKLQLLQPDYVLMQFAYSECCGDPDRSTSFEEFKDNLRFLIDTIRGWNGTPILVTLHASREWDPQGHLIPSRHPRDAFTMEVAAEKHAALLDFYPITFDIFTQLGPNGVGFMEWASADPMHFSVAGAVYVSRFLAQALPDDLGPYLTKIFDPTPKP